MILLVKSQPNCLPYGYVCCCFPSPKAPQRALLFNQTTVHKAWPFSRARLNPLISAIIPSTALPMNMGRRKQTLETRPHQSDFPTKDKPRFGAIPLKALLCYYWHEHKIAQKALTISNTAQLLKNGVRDSLAIARWILRGNHEHDEHGPAVNLCWTNFTSPKASEGPKCH